MAGLPPCGQRQVQQEEYAQGTRWPYPQAQQQRNPNQQFDHTDKISEEHRMRLHDPCQNWPVETHRCAVYIAPQICLESAVRETGTGDFVFTKEQKEKRRGDAYDSNHLGGCRRSWHSFNVGNQRPGKVTLQDRRWKRTAPATPVRGSNRQPATPAGCGWKECPITCHCRRPPEDGGNGAPA